MLHEKQRQHVHTRVEKREESQGTAVLYQPVPAREPPQRSNGEGGCEKAESPPPRLQLDFVYRVSDLGARDAPRQVQKRVKTGREQERLEQPLPVFVELQAQ
jgi:hypothetical protein